MEVRGRGWEREAHQGLMAFELGFEGQMGTEQGTSFNCLGGYVSCVWAAGSHRAEAGKAV